MPALSANLDYFPAVNFAMQQNGLPYIKSVTITNLTESRIDNVWFNLSFEPQFAENISVRIGSLMPWQVVEVGDEHFDVKLSFDFLVGLTERILGYNVIDVYSGDTLVYHEKYDVYLLALEECPLRVSPALIAAFVMPNHPVLVPVLRRASDKLDILSPALSGYQRKDKDFVKNQMKAVYMALKELEITYVSAPPSFFKPIGQRLRLVDDVVTNRLGTCIDTSVLFASCLEAMDLNPLIILVEGHAFVGCYLEDGGCDNPVITDFDFMVEMCQRDLIEFIETTAVTRGANLVYEEAVDRAVETLFEGGFQCALDIKRLRDEIHPLPQRVLQEYWDNTDQISTVPTQPALLPDAGEITMYDGDLYYIYLNDVIYGPYLLEQMQDLSLLPDTLITTNRLNGEWYEAKDFGCFANKFIAGLETESVEGW